MNAATKSPRTLVNTLSSLLLGLALGLAGGCDAGDPAHGPNGPQQIVEAGIGEAQVMQMMELADLGDAAGVADYHLYVPSGDLDLSAANCGEPNAAVVESTCGACQCQPGGGIVCIDDLCDPAALRFDAAPAEGPQSTVDFAWPPAVCEGHQQAGESRMDDCNVCTCLGDGTVGCTRMRCDALDAK